MHKQLLASSAKIFFAAAFLSSSFVNAQVHRFQNTSAREGYSVLKMDEKGITAKFSANQFEFEDRVVKGVTMKGINFPGMFLPNEAGFPDLPGNAKYIALPQGAKPVVKIKSYDLETIKNIEISPAPVIPLVTDDNPLKFEKNADAYSKNEFYPASPVQLLQPTVIRGIDVVMLGVTPFQYNPVTKELLVYNNLEVEVTFEGGNGHFGDDAYRSRWWEPIMQDMFLNYNQLTPFNQVSTLKKGFSTAATDTGCEYIIITPNSATFAQWADSIKKFRREQGILTNVYSLNDIGSTTSAGIKTWLSAAYNTWDIKPAAVLMLGDYGTTPTSTLDANLYTHPAGYPDYASDNFYADITNDDLPDVAISRIVANTSAQLQVMCSKFLNYERNPPTDPNFYAKPITAIGWQDDRWFQVCGEIVGGFFRSIGKTPSRTNALGSPANNTGNNVPNTGTWSTASNTTTILNYFGPSGLNYIPAQPGTLGGFSGATATTVNTAINNGSFLLLHRDHGYYQGWGDPVYSNTSINSLTNISNKLPFVFSVNCQSGAYQHTSECFAEKFHRYTKNGVNSGALGLIADSEVSYSFVNDVIVWGMFDNLWTNFLPAYSTNPPDRDKRPAFALTSGKYFLQQSSWCGSGSKQITYRLFHMFGDAFQWFYSEVPQNLTVVHNSFIPQGDTAFDVTATVGSFIAITQAVPGGPEILGTATGTGAPVTIQLSQAPTTNILVTVTKQDYFRYGQTVSFSPTGVANDITNSLSLACFPNPFSDETNITYFLGKAGNVSLTVYDMLGQEVKTILKNGSQASGPHTIKFSSENLSKGTYSCVLKTESGVVTKNLVIE